MAKSDHSKAAPTLTELVESLKLSAGRSQIGTKSASTMTPREMEKARILQLLTIDIGNQRVKPLTSLEALSRDIVMHINETAIYFDLFRPVDSTSAPVQIPAQVIDHISTKKVITHEQYVNAVTSLTVCWVVNNLGKNDHNPFVIEVVAQDIPADKASRSLPETEDSNPEYPEMRIDQLAPSEDATINIDQIKRSLSWFYPLNLTAEPQGEGQRSELTVQHIVGSVIRYTAQLAECRVWTNLKLKYPEILKLAYEAEPSDPTKEPKGSDCLPDIATIPMIPGKAHRFISSDDILEQLLQPVTIVGEAKRSQTGDRGGEEVDPEKPHFTVQLMMAVHPALILLILFHLKGQAFDPKIHKNRLPKEFFIYGVYYDEKRFIVYVHFPYFSVDEDNYGWRFAQAKVKEFDFATYDRTSTMEQESARRRLQFAIAMQTVREHGRKLFKLFTSTEYKEVVEKIVASSQ